MYDNYSNSILSVNSTIIPYNLELYCTLIESKEIVLSIPHYLIHYFSLFTEQERRIMDLQGEVMACGYEDVQVMWSMLDRSKSTATECNITSSS